MLKLAERDTFDPMTDPFQITAPSSTPQAASPGALEKTPLERYVPPAKPSLVGLSRGELAEALGRIGVPAAQRKMRAQQIWHWLYVRGAARFDAMTSVSKELRATLDAHFTLARPEVVAEQTSVDGTRKWLLRLPGEHAGERPHEVECVYIPEADRGTLCVSSQVGCTLTCSFCHTGTQRLVRNLTAGEIVGQVMVARDRLGDWQRKSGLPDLRTSEDFEVGLARLAYLRRFEVWLARLAYLRRFEAGLARLAHLRRIRSRACPTCAPQKIRSRARRACAPAIGTRARPSSRARARKAEAASAWSPIS